jgi:hypothetical protein
MTIAGKMNTEKKNPPRHGHIPGAEVGEVFGGRGELAVLGLHGKMMSGIDW